MASYLESPPPFSLTITGGGENGEKFIFEQSEVTLGRIADNDLVLYDASVSRRHAVVYHRNGQFILEDLGSSNGTILNGYLINQPTVLCEGDQLVVGAVHFQFSGMVFDDNDDPTEIEGWIPQTSDSIPQLPVASPVVVPRGQLQQGGPLPYEGNTQNYSAERLNAAMQQQFGSNEQQFGSNDMGNLEAGRPQQPLGIGQHPAKPQPPPRPQVQAPAQPQPGYSQPQMHAHPPSPSGQNFPGHRGPSSPQIPQPAAPPPKMPHPGHGYAQPAPKVAAPPSANLQQAAVSRQRARRSLHQQKQQMVQLTLWSGVLFLLSSAFFLIPARSSSLSAIQEKPVFLATNRKEQEKIYGYNTHDRNHPKRLIVQFSYRNGRTWISYRILSHVPVDLLVNSKPFTSVSPSAKQWVYFRHEIPRNLLKLNRFNTITFQRADKRNGQALWGLTHLKMKEQSLPSTDLDKAKAACQVGYQLNQKRDSKPTTRYKAIVSFQECMDYLALMLEPPPLYKQAEIMITRINNELDVIYRQKLQQASTLKSPIKKLEVYNQLLAYFKIDPSDQRYQRVKQLLQQLRASSGK